jgi:hypothetical protein
MMLKSALKATTKASKPDRTQWCPPPNGRSVTFASKSSVRPIPSLRDMTRTEREALWRTPEEVESKREEIEETIRELRKKSSLAGQSLFTVSTCHRGLEHLASTHNFNFLLAERKFHQDAIFYVQRKCGSHEAIAAVSCDITGAAKERAYVLGKTDEAIARRLISSERLQNILNATKNGSPRLAKARSA